MFRLKKRIASSQKKLILLLKKAFFLLKIVFLALLIILAVANKDKFESLYFKFFDQLPKIEKLAEKVEEKIPQEIKKEVKTPPPLRAKEESPQAFLTVQGVIRLTNLQREENGLPPLVGNSLLNQSALAKVQDMLAKQYFAHDSPEGLDVSDLVESVGYDFINIGENLALGNFLNDEVLVQGWMESPGHRENILNSSYQEIGVAVLKGNYQGKTTWLAVQHFGRPLSACPQPDASLKQKIEANQNLLDQLASELEVKKQELEATRPKRGPEYEQKVEEFNRLVEEYNNLVNETKSLIDQYNQQIASFNQCVQ